MRRSAGRVGVRAAIVGVAIACSMFGQASELRQDLESLRHEAEAAASKGEFAAAISLYQSVISAAQESSWAHRGLADCYRVNGAWAKAADEYEAVAKIDSTDVNARQLASLTRQALAEQRDDVVKAETFSAIKKFPLSWTPMNSAARNSPADYGPGGRNIGFSRQPAAATAAQSIPVQVAFPRNKWTLDEKATRQLAEVAASIVSAPERPESIVVEGHTCGCGSVDGNNELGRRRAETVRDFLISKGVAPADRITSISYGSSRPVESAGAPQLPAAVCERDAVHSENRRVVILLYGLVASVTPPPPPLDVSFLSRRPGSRSFEVLPDGGRLRTGDEYMIRLRAQKAVYAYVFHRQADGTWIALVPDAQLRAGSAAIAVSVEPNRDVSIPSTSAGFELDPSTGVEETIIYSRLEPDKDLETLVGAIQAAPSDNGYVRLLPHLLPPDLPDPPKPVVHTTIKQTKPGSFSDKPPLDRQREGTVTPVPENKPAEAPAGSEQHKPGELRGLVMKDPRAKDWPRLPADPAAYVRYDHLPKQGN
jgi:peptidoglycan-associated lipoprotein